MVTPSANFCQGDIEKGSNKGFLQKCLSLWKVVLFLQVSPKRYFLLCNQISFGCCSKLLFGKWMKKSLSCRISWNVNGK